MALRTMHCVVALCSLYQQGCFSPGRSSEGDSRPCLVVAQSIQIMFCFVFKHLLFLKNLSILPISPNQIHGLASGNFKKNQKNSLTEHAIQINKLLHPIIFFKPFHAKTCLSLMLQNQLCGGKVELPGKGVPRPRQHLDIQRSSPKWLYAASLTWVETWRRLFWGWYRALGEIFGEKAVVLMVMSSLVIRGFKSQNEHFELCPETSW